MILPWIVAVRAANILRSLTGWHAGGGGGGGGGWGHRYLDTKASEDDFVTGLKGLTIRFGQIDDLWAESEAVRRAPRSSATPRQRRLALQLEVIGNERLKGLYAEAGRQKDRVKALFSFWTDSLTNAEDSRALNQQLIWIRQRVDQIARAMEIGVGEMRALLSPQSEESPKKLKRTYSTGTLGAVPKLKVEAAPGVNTKRLRSMSMAAEDSEEDVALMRLKLGVSQAQAFLNHIKKEFKGLLRDVRRILQGLPESQGDLPDLQKRLLEYRATAERQVALEEARLRKYEEEAEALRATHPTQTVNPIIENIAGIMRKAIAALRKQSSVLESFQERLIGLTARLKKGQRGAIRFQLRLELDEARLAAQNVRRKAHELRGALQVYQRLALLAPASAATFKKVDEARAFLKERIPKIEVRLQRVKGYLQALTARQQAAAQNPERRQTMALMVKIRKAKERELRYVERMLSDCQILLKAIKIW